MADLSQDKAYQLCSKLDSLSFSEAYQGSIGEGIDLNPPVSRCRHPMLEKLFVPAGTKLLFAETLLVLSSSALHRA